jgi:hypothetical protein
VVVDAGEKESERERKRNLFQVRRKKCVQKEFDRANIVRDDRANIVRDVRFRVCQASGLLPSAR